MTALEVIREIVGFGEGLFRRLVMLDAARYGLRRWLQVDPANPLTGQTQRSTIYRPHA